MASSYHLKIAICKNTNKPYVIYIKIDNPHTGLKAIEKCKDIYATENGTAPIPPVLARIKVSPEKSTSSEIQRLQFPLSLAWACTVD